MALVHDAKKEIHAKIVYYGPGRSGKTTNLEFIYNKLKPAYRGKFKFMNTPGGKMVFFDFMRPELAAIEDYGVHFHIYTIPGESIDPSVWKNVLKGVDGIVFVADLEPSRTLENRRCLDGLRDYLGSYGIRLDDIPHIFQCNKRDVQGSVSVDELKSLLDIGDATVVPASARSGEGVLPALSEMVKMVLQRLRDLPLGAQEEESTDGEETGIAAGVPEQEVAPPAPEPETAAFESATLSLEPDVATFDSEPLTLEPVEDDADYSLETEPVETAGPESLDFPPLAEAAYADAPAEAFVYDTMDQVTPEAPAETVFEVPSWGADEEPCEPDTGSLELGGPETVEEEELAEAEIELAGGMESLGGGRFRLPIIVRYGGRESMAALSFDISIEKPDTFRRHAE